MRRSLIQPRRVVTATLLAAVVGFVSGCGEEPPKPADPVLARNTLEKALAAWKEGKPAESLETSEPPVLVSDHEWSEGTRLVRYEVEGADRPSGADHVFQVTLWLEDAGGKSVCEHTEFFVGTEPTLRIIRSGL